jgi:hypothetical protein
MLFFYGPPVREVVRRMYAKIYAQAQPASVIEPSWRWRVGIVFN